MAVIAEVGGGGGYPKEQPQKQPQKQPQGQLDWRKLLESYTAAIQEVPPVYPIPVQPQKPIPWGEMYQAWKYEREWAVTPDESDKPLTKAQYNRLIDERIKQTPPAVMADLRRTAESFVRRGYVQDVDDFIRLEIGDWVGQDIGLSSDVAHRASDRASPGVREGLRPIMQPAPIKATWLPMIWKDIAEKPKEAPPPVPVWKQALAAIPAALGGAAAIPPGIEEAPPPSPAEMWRGAKALPVVGVVPRTAEQAVGAALKGLAQPAYWTERAIGYPLLTQPEGIGRFREAAMKIPSAIGGAAYAPQIPEVVVEHERNLRERIAAKVQAADLAPRERLDLARITYTWLVDPERLEKALDDMKGGATIEQVVQKHQAIVPEMIGQIILDPLNIVGSAIGKARDVKLLDKVRAQYIDEAAPLVDEAVKEIPWFKRAFQGAAGMIEDINPFRLTANSQARALDRHINSFVGMVLSKAETPDDVSGIIRNFINTPEKLSPEFGSFVRSPVADDVRKALKLIDFDTFKSLKVTDEAKAIQMVMQGMEAPPTEFKLMDFLAELYDKSIGATNKVYGVKRATTPERWAAGLKNFMADFYMGISPRALIRNMAGNLTFAGYDGLLSFASHQEIDDYMLRCFGFSPMQAQRGLGLAREYSGPQRGLPIIRDLAEKGRKIYTGQTPILGESWMRYQATYAAMRKFDNLYWRAGTGGLINLSNFDDIWPRLDPSTKTNLIAGWRQAMNADELLANTDKALEGARMVARYLDECEEVSTGFVKALQEAVDEATDAAGAIDQDKLAVASQDILAEIEKRVARAQAIDGIAPKPAAVPAAAPAPAPAAAPAPVPAPVAAPAPVPAPAPAAAPVPVPATVVSKATPEIAARVASLSEAGAKKRLDILRSFLGEAETGKRKVAEGVLREWRAEIGLLEQRLRTPVVPEVTPEMAARVGGGVRPKEAALLPGIEYAEELRRGRPPEIAERMYSAMVREQARFGASAEGFILDAQEMGKAAYELQMWEKGDWAANAWAKHVSADVPFPRKMSDLRRLMEEQPKLVLNWQDYLIRQMATRNTPSWQILQHRAEVKDIVRMLTLDTVQEIAQARPSAKLELEDLLGVLPEIPEPALPKDIGELARAAGIDPTTAGYEEWEQVLGYARQRFGYHEMRMAPEGVDSIVAKEARRLPQEGWLFGEWRQMRIGRMSAKQEKAFRQSLKPANMTWKQFYAHHGNAAQAYSDLVDELEALLEELPRPVDEAAGMTAQQRVVLPAGAEPGAPLAEGAYPVYPRPEVREMAASAAQGRAAEAAKAARRRAEAAERAAKVEAKVATLKDIPYTQGIMPDELKAGEAGWRLRGGPGGYFVEVFDPEEWRWTVKSSAGNYRTAAEDFKRHLIAEGLTDEDVQRGLQKLRQSGMMAYSDGVEAAAKAERGVLRRLIEEETGAIRIGRERPPKPRVEPISDDLKQAIRDRVREVLVPARNDANMAKLQWAYEVVNRALYDYDKRYEIDRLLQLIFPFHFWHTRTGYQAAVRTVTKPWTVTSYYRTRQALEKINQDMGFPRRYGPTALRVPVPEGAVPEWAEKEVAIDLAPFIFPSTAVWPFNYLAKINWDDNAEAKSALDRVADLEAILNMAPHWPLSMALDIARGKEEAVEYVLPQTGVLKGITAALKDRYPDRFGWIPPGGVNLEKPFRVGTGLPETAGYEDVYWPESMVIDMAANGEITPAQRDALLNPADAQYHSGPIWDEAVNRAAVFTQLPNAISYFAGIRPGLVPTGEMKIRKAAREELGPLYEREAAGEKGPAIREERSKWYKDNPWYTGRGLLWTPGPERKVQFREREYLEQRNAIYDRYANQLDSVPIWDWQQRQAIYQTRQKELDALDAEYPDVNITPSFWGYTPGEIVEYNEDQALRPLADAYYAIRPEGFQDAEGNIDWDAFYAARDDFMNNLQTIAVKKGLLETGVYADFAVGGKPDKTALTAWLTRGRFERYLRRNDDPKEALWQVYKTTVINPAQEKMYRDAQGKTGEEKQKVFERYYNLYRDRRATDLITRVLAAYPEKGWTYGELEVAYSDITLPGLAKIRQMGQTPRDRAIADLWNFYMALPTLDKRRFREELGERFDKYFVNKETRNYEAIGDEELISWLNYAGMDAEALAEMAEAQVGAKVQEAQQMAEQAGRRPPPPVTGEFIPMPQFKLSDPVTSKEYDQALTERSQMWEQVEAKWPRFSDWADLYSKLEPWQVGERKAMQELLQAAWDFMDEWKQAHPVMTKWLYSEPIDDPRGQAISDLWNFYMGLSALDKRRLKEELGDRFNTLFISEDTRNYDRISTEELMAWLGYVGLDSGLGRKVAEERQLAAQAWAAAGKPAVQAKPEAPAPAPTAASKLAAAPGQSDVLAAAAGLFQPTAPEISAEYDQALAERAQMWEIVNALWPSFSALMDAYNALKWWQFDEREALRAELEPAWNFMDSWKASHPTMVKWLYPTWQPYVPRAAAPAAAPKAAPAAALKAAPAAAPKAAPRARAPTKEEVLTETAQAWRDFAKTIEDKPLLELIQGYLLLSPIQRDVYMARFPQLAAWLQGKDIAWLKMLAESLAAHLALTEGTRQRAPRAPTLRWYQTYD